MMLCVFLVFSLATLTATSGFSQNGTESFISSCIVRGDCTDSSHDKYRLRRQILLQQPQQAGACVLPLRPDNGQYEVTNVPDAHPGQTFDYVTLTVTCRRGYGVVDAGDGTDDTGSKKVYCINGKWSQSMPKCVRFCKLDPDPSVRYMCHVSGTNGFKTCNKYVAPGTSVSPVCNSPIYYSVETLLYMKCTAGTWDYVAKCKAECGRVTPEGQQLIIDGRQAKRGELPWHVGVYRKSFKPYKQICGGTLVSNSVVISAGHCFWHDVKKLLPFSEFAVAAGKLYRPWKDEHDVDAQKSDVKNIMVPRLFQGESANFQEDIAILVLASPFVYKTYVRPVCLSFDVNFDRWQLQEGKLGKTAGWGLTAANGPASRVLKVVEVPFVNSETCINTLPPAFREYITGDKFCAGYTNGTSLCQGDSGGGLAFADKELGIDRYYLRGIASAAPTSDGKFCNDEAYTTFTKISKHEMFIKQAVAALDKKSCELTEFQCSDGSCVDQDAECNGKQECADGSDESEQLCKPEINEDTKKNADSCILPPYPSHGTYKVANLPTARPGQFLESFVLTVTCDEGYGIADSDSNETSSQQVYCVNGAWYQIMPRCVRFCQVKPDPSIRFVTCQVPGSGFNTCQDYVPPGTTVIPTCNTPNYFSDQVLPFMTCLDGIWDYTATCQSAFCKLEPDPNTRYMCRDPEADEFKVCDNLVSPGLTVKPICDEANNKTGHVLKNMICTLGVWDNVVKCKTDSCQLEKDPSIKYLCEDDDTNDLKLCNTTVAVGTSVVPVCNTPYYYSEDALQNMTCTDESWDHVAKCVPECGRITTLKLQTLHDNADGGFITREIIPWHVAIKQKKDINKIYDYGTLITNKAIVTDAHNFYEFDRQQLDLFTRYIAEVRETAFLDTNNRVQQSDVKTIHVMDELVKSDGVLYDIAVLELATPFVFNLYVSPICVNFNIDFEEYQLAIGLPAKVGHWGQFNKNELAAIDLNTCRNDLKPDVPDIFEDKICFTYSRESAQNLATNKNAGVFFPYNHSGVVRHYYRGILDGGCYIIGTDNKAFCSLNYAWSTKLSRYKEFIQKFL